MVKMYNEAEKIRRKNMKFNSTLPLVFDKFRKAGFSAVLIKGQGISLMYPDSMMRTPGDIDIWLGGDRKYVEEFAKKENPEAKTYYHHIEGRFRFRRQFRAIFETGQPHLPMSWHKAGGNSGNVVI